MPGPSYKYSKEILKELDQFINELNKKSVEKIPTQYKDPNNIINKVYSLLEQAHELAKQKDLIESTKNPQSKKIGIKSASLTKHIIDLKLSTKLENIIGKLLMQEDQTLTMDARIKYQNVLNTLNGTPIQDRSSNLGEEISSSRSGSESDLESGSASASENESIGPDEPNEEQLGTDQSNHYFNLIRKFANIEHLGHSLAYKKQLTKFKQISIIQDNNQPAEAYIHPVITKNKNLVCTILEIPSTDPNEPHKIEVLWRGTHNKGSAIMDLDPKSAGFTAYMLERNTILSAVSESIQRLQEKDPQKSISIGSYGHSLGGNLAQMFAVDVMEVMAQNHSEQLSASSDNSAKYSATQFSIPRKIRSNFTKIKQLTIGILNSSGTSKEIADRAAKLEEYLHTNVTEDQRTKISLFAVQNASDPVQKTGETVILADSTKSQVYVFKEGGRVPNDTSDNSEQTTSSTLKKVGRSILEKVTFVKAIDTIKKIKSAPKAHTKKHFSPSGELNRADLKFQIYDNTNEEQRQYIIRELSDKKSKFLQKPAVKTLQAKIFYRFFKKIDKPQQPIIFHNNTQPAHSPKPKDHKNIKP